MPSDRENIRRVYRDLPVATVSEFATVGQVRHALRELEQGRFALAAQLVDAMGRDDRIKSTTRTRVQGLLGCPLSFEADGDKRRSGAVVKDVESWFWQAYQEQQIAQLVRWGLHLGLGIGELVWTRTARRWTHVLKVWHPQFCWWDWSTRTYQLQTEDGVVSITPGDGKWVLFTPFGLERGWMEGLAREVAVPWLVRQWARRDTSRRSEVHGLPIKKATVPDKAKDAERDAFYKDLSQLHAEGLVILPKNAEGFGYDLELLDAPEAAEKLFELQFNHAEASISISVLGQNLTTEVKQGSRAAATVHDKVRQDLKEYDANVLSSCLHDQALVPWARFNVGDESLAPYPRWKVEPPADLKTDAETLNALGDALTKLKLAGLDVDAALLAERYAIPLRSTKPLPPAREDVPEQLAAREDQPAGMVEGQAYADAVADAARNAAAKVLEPDVDELLAAIDQAKDFDELRGTLVKLYAAMDPTALADLTKDAALLAHLAGRRSQRLDL